MDEFIKILEAYMKYEDKQADSKFGNYTFPGLLEFMKKQNKK